MLPAVADFQYKSMSFDISNCSFPLWGSHGIPAGWQWSPCCLLDNHGLQEGELCLLSIQFAMLD